MIANLVRNTDVNRADRPAPVLRAIRCLAAEAGPRFSSELPRVSDQAGGFNQQQRPDERIKALLLLRHPGWRPLLDRRATPFLHRGRWLPAPLVGLHHGSSRPRHRFGQQEAPGLRRIATWYARTCEIFPESA